MDFGEPNEPHFVLLPLMSPGHLIPMTDMGKLLARHGVNVTIVTTPLNAVRLESTIERSSRSGLRIQVLTLDFQGPEAGLPPGCESMDALPCRSLIKNFYEATNMLRRPFEDLLRRIRPAASCVVSGKNLGWTADTCKAFGIPRIFFDGMGCFAFSCANSLEASGAHEAGSFKEAFVVPGLPHRVELTRAKLPESLSRATGDMNEVRERMRGDEASPDGVVVNTFAGMEGEYVREYKRVKGGRVWCVGPVSAVNEAEVDKAERGGEEGPSATRRRWLEWLDGRERGSVVYACLGSICGLSATQVKEVGLGLEASGRPFVWAVRGGGRSEGLERWIRDEGFEERTHERGLLIRGWAPQLAILSHPAVGAFLTHCGWNSTLEGVSAGLPLLTCPLFAEQFLNEKLVVEILRVGVSVGVEAAVTWGLEERSGLVMRREGVKAAVEKALDGGDEGQARRTRARVLADVARRSLQPCGSSYLDIQLLIHYVKRL